MKKFLTVLLTIALSVCIAAGFAACDDKAQQIRYLTALDSNGSAFDNLSLGDFTYKSSPEQSGNYPDVKSVGFQVTYEDGSSSAVSANDAALKIKEIRHNGQTVETEPDLYDVGLWEYVFDYKGFNATVSFNILPSTQAGYVLSGIPESWQYSAMPDLTETATVSGYGDPLVFTGENANIRLYYIDADRYSELTGSGTLNIDILNDYIHEFSQFYPDQDYYIPAGDYRFFAEMSLSGNYADQLTNAVSVTVEKERLTFTPPADMTASYYFTNSNKPGNVKISKVDVPVQSATTTNLAGEQIVLQSLYRSWLDPDEEVSAATPEKTYKFLFEPIYVDASNYDVSALVGECTVIVYRGYVGGDNDEFSFGDDLPLVIDRTVEINDYNENGGLSFFNTMTVTNDMYKIDGFFSMVDVRDSNGKKLPVYSYETAPEPAIAGDEGASAKVVRTYYNEGVYDYFIMLNDDAEFKDYSFTVSLIDDVNFRWGDYSRDYGSDPITLNYTVERNDNGQHFQYESSTLTDGKFTFDLYLNYAAYDASLLDTLSITMTDSYTDEYGYTTTTTESVTMDCDAIETTVHDSDPDMFKISVSVPVTLPAKDFSYYFVCMEIKMQTAENYKDVKLSTFAALLKI